MSRAAAVADALAAGNLPRVYSADGFQVTVTRYSVSNTSVTVWGDVTKGGVSLPISWPVVVVNPPTLVPDPAGDVSRTYQDVNGASRTIMFRTDPLAALYQALVDVAKDVL